MRPLKLHTKTTVLASAITVAVLAMAVALISPLISDILNRAQRDRAELQAINLAEQISHIPVPRDALVLAQAANLVRGARKDLIAVRIYERVGGKFVPTAEAANSAPPEDIPEETIAALRSGLPSNVPRPLPPGVNAAVFRVFAPITELEPEQKQRRINGAVELVESLGDAPLITVRFERTATWMALAAVFLITLATYLLFRHLVYHPIERLLLAMSYAEAGDLLAEAPPRAPDELGLLSRGFNRMIARIRKMTEEREAHRQSLQEQVQEATAELTERNRKLSEITLRLTELERLAAAGQTAAQFAHEVGTPLNLISGHVQLLRSRLSGDQSAQARLETISAQIERIERIVRGMLDRTRPVAPALAPVDLNALLLRTFDATAPALDARGVKLETDLAQQLPKVAGDADLLQQVFINLINNALDAMPGGGRLFVKTRVFPGGDDVHSRETSSGEDRSREVFIEFIDNGTGVAEEMRGRIFEPFYTSKTTGLGTGLGLVVVKQVAREHGGEVEVESPPGEGACFRLRFPVLERGKQVSFAEEPEAEFQRAEIGK
jgi:two-component system NtrC family sensor kinase